MIPIIDKDTITEEDLQQLITLKVEESIYLDFKEAAALDLTDKKKMEVAKDVSSFANSAGGVIIYGIKEINHVADSFTFIDGDVYTKEWIEQVIQSGIQRKVEGLVIFPVRFKNDIKQTIYVVKIPESSFAPHMTKDKRFYKRYNFQSVQMEEYEIRSLYNRKEMAELTINSVTFLKPKYENRGLYNEIVFFPMGFQVENIGKTIERDFKIIVTVDFKDYIIKWDSLNGSKINRSFIGEESSQVSISNLSPIFPNEILEIGSIDFGITKSMFPIVMQKEVILKVKLLFINGVDEIDVPNHTFKEIIINDEK